MEKKAIDHLEEIYKDEINSHDIKKAINNVDIMSFKIKDFISIIHFIFIFFTQ